MTQRTLGKAGLARPTHGPRPGRNEELTTWERLSRGVEGSAPGVAAQRTAAGIEKAPAY